LGKYYQYGESAKRAPWSRVLHDKNNSSNNSPPFMETKGLLPCVKDPTTRSYPKPDESSPHSQKLFLSDPLKYYLPPTSRYPRCSPLFRFSDENFVYASHFLGIIRSKKMPYMCLEYKYD
jgi:hypothetical protein